MWIACSAIAFFFYFKIYLMGFEPTISMLKTRNPTIRQLFHLSKKIHFNFDIHKHKKITTHASLMFFVFVNIKWKG